MQQWISALLAFAMCVMTGGPAYADSGRAETRTIRIIGTSDLHGKFMPWNYALNQEDKSGSMAQLATAVAQYRTDAMLLLDAGDTIQDNSAEIFLGREGIHPMILAMNALGYDAVATGNHDYNYGMDSLRQAFGSAEARVLAGNVYDENGKRVGGSYAIFDVGGVRVAVIGMVTPNIARWDAENLAECTVTDPLDETRAVIDSIRGQYDVLVGIFHMAVYNEFNVPNSGVTDILNACPEFDVMISSHSHIRIPGTEINGVLVVQNLNMAQTMSVIDLTLEKNGDGWRVTGRSSESVSIADFEPDPDMMKMLEPYHKYAVADAEQVIGVLEGDQLVPDSEITAIPTALIEDTALMDVIHTVQMYYSGARVSAAAYYTYGANMYPGVIHKCDTSRIYAFNNTLYRIRMTGAQLKRYMEWSASFYNTWKPGDLTISFNPEIRTYNYDMFGGVRYEIDISREPGNRIVNLTWPDGTPVRDDEEFDVAVNNYRAGSQLLAPGVIFDADDMPVLVESDIRSDIGGPREMIAAYITSVKGGKLVPECDHSWRLVGYKWDAAMHARAVALLNAGVLTLPDSEDHRTHFVRPVTEQDVLNAENAPGTGAP